jgi:hypothetical protein
MFFYLLYNSTLIEKELDEYNRSIKVLIYGSIAYIVLHAVLFIGGKDALLHSLKVYFWLFLVLDAIVLFLMNNKNNKTKNIFDSIFNKKKKENKEKIIYNKTLQPNNSIIRSNTRPSRKKVHFNVENHYESSDSDSDIGTDIDIASFKESLLE